MIPAGLKSLAVAFPSQARPNSYFREHHPDAVAAAEERAAGKLWVTRDGGAPHPFEEEMSRYLADPFRGAILRRVLAPGETPLDLELRAARDALAAADMQANDVDAAIVSSFHANQLEVGNGAFLARDLGLRCGAFNLESACSGANVALQTACALVASGQHRNVLVVVSCTYSRTTDEASELAWFAGDGAAAFVIGPVRPGQGLLGARTIPTVETCGAFFWRCVQREGEEPRWLMDNSDRAGALIRDHSADWLRTCSRGALDAAGISIEDVDFFIFNTPSAWYGRFCARVLGVPPERTIDTYRLYANIGSVLMPANLFEAAWADRIRTGHRVLLYSVGSVSTAAAVLLGWDDVALGPPVSGNPALAA